MLMIRPIVPERLRDAQNRLKVVPWTSTVCCARPSLMTPLLQLFTPSDGGNTPSRPVYHSSDHSVGEYWQVDLGADTTLAYSELFTRAGKDAGNTTHQFDVQVLDSSMNGTASSGV